MRDRLSKAVIAVLLAIISAAPAPAHQGDIVFPIYELPSADLPDVHDGTLEDWDAVLPDASLTHNDFVWQANATGSIPVEDMAFRVFLAWHRATQRIFVGFEGIDDMLWPYAEGSGGEGFMAGNGSFSFSVDGDHTAGKYQYFVADGYSEAENRRLFGAQAQGYSMRQDVLDGRFFLIASWAEWATRPPWGDAGYERYGEAPSHIIQEFWVTPWDDLDPEGPEQSRRSGLWPGKIIGISMSVTDFDDSNGPDGFFYLAPIRFRETVSDGSFGHSGFAENFSDAELIPCHVGDCGSAPVTAVVVDSWGRIKASFR